MGLHFTCPTSFDSLVDQLFASTPDSDGIISAPDSEHIYFTDPQKSGGACKDEIEHVPEASEHIHKKKRKHKKESDDGTNLGTEHILDKNSNGLNGLDSSNDLEKLKSAGDAHDEVKDKKMKKKKHKMSSDGLDENAAHNDQKEKLQEIVKEKIAELNSLTNMSSALQAESDVKHKGEKKKKKKTEATIESVSVDGNGHTMKALEESELIKEKTATTENVDKIEKKAHKKRKRLDSEERASQDGNGTARESYMKLEGAENNKECGTPKKQHRSLPDSEHTAISKKRKTEKGSEGFDNAGKASHEEQDASGQDVRKESGAHQLANGEPGKSENEGGKASKSKKKEKHSAEV